MAKKTPEEMLAAAQAILGENTSDDAIAFIEDLSDSLKSEGTDWEAKYNENDAAWRKRYMDRFMGNDDGDPVEPVEPEGVKTLTYENLFKED